MQAAVFLDPFIFGLEVRMLLLMDVSLLPCGMEVVRFFKPLVEWSEVVPVGIFLSPC
jgi:hypothetical protein